MTTTSLRPWTARQHGLVAVWQLTRADWTRKQIRCRVGRLREIHDGVYLTGDAPATELQGWWAATLTAPERYLSRESSGAAHGYLPTRPRRHETVTTSGSGGPRRYGDVLVCRSTTLAGHVGDLRGLPIVSPARTLVDLAPRLGERALDRALREALRLRVVTCADVHLALLGAPSRRGTAFLTDRVREYARLPINRTRSDAEAEALRVFQAAGTPPPVVNRVVAGLECDLSWPRRRLIIELDGPSFHQFPARDREKTVRWEAAGWTVRRLSTDVPFDDPALLLATYAEPTVSEGAPPPRQRMS